MDNFERVKVYIKYEKEKMKCICLQSDKKCNEDCEKDILLRDKYREWEKTFKHDKFGRSNLK